MEKIPVFSPLIDINTVKNLVDAFDVGWLGMGALTKEFEALIARYLDLKNRFVVATNTGTSALHLGLLVAGVGPGDEVITPSFNYVSDHQAILMTGADVVMCDICEDDLGIDCEKAEKLITSKTKAIIPLHFAGIPCEQKKVFELADKHSLRVIEDGCHAFGTYIDNKKIGSYGDITCFSFDPGKIITSIDGGCVIANNEEELSNLQHMRILGVDKDTTTRYQNKRAWDYDVVSEGFRYHLANIMASIGISQIKRIDEFIESRQKVCQRYNESFRDIKGLKVPNSDFRGVSSFIYSLRVLDGKREKLIEHLQSLDVDAGIHFLPVHKHEFFANARSGELTVTEKIADEVLTLPLHSLMKEDFVIRIIDAVKSFFR